MGRKEAGHKGKGECDESVVVRCRGVIYERVYSRL